MEAIKVKKRINLKGGTQTKILKDEKLSKPRAEFDTPWKDIFNAFFQDFVAYCWPEQYTKIDWTKGYKMLDKELSKIARNAPISNKVADKLIEAHLKTGEDINILIHIEVQGTKKVDFEQRMFIHYYRLWDRYRKPIASLAVLIDGDHRWRPNTFKQSFWGTSIEIWFPYLKLVDFLDKKSELEASNNRFAAVILSQLAVLEKQPLDAKLISKVNLIKWLYRKGWEKDDVLTLLTFIDWVFKLPEPFEEQCRIEIETFEEEMKMRYVTSWERHYMKKGLEQGLEQGIDMGVQKGEGTLLLRLLQCKFKKIPDPYRQQIEEADAETLLLWGERVLDCNGLEEIFKP